jgi:hypothetical protein
MKHEDWRPIPGHECWYEISNFGRVRSRIVAGKGSLRSHPDSRILSQHPNEWGYMLVTLSRPKRRTWQSHRLVLRSFAGEPPSPTHQANHKNGDVRDNRVENLEWVTPAENLRHRNDVLGHAPDLTGMKNPAHVLTEDNVRAMRAQHATGMVTATALSRQYGVSVTTVCLIVKGVRWPHVR